MIKVEFCSSKWSDLSVNFSIPDLSNAHSVRYWTNRGFAADNNMATCTLLLSHILTVSFVLRVIDGQGEVTERVCLSYHKL